MILLSEPDPGKSAGAATEWLDYGGSTTKRDRLRHASTSRRIPSGISSPLRSREPARALGAARGRSLVRTGLGGSPRGKPDLAGLNRT